MTEAVPCYLCGMIRPVPLLYLSRYGMPAALADEVWVQNHFELDDQGEADPNERIGRYLCYPDCAILFLDGLLVEADAHERKRKQG